MNKIGKILVVAIAVASVSFMGFAAALLVGGRNYEDDIDLLKNGYRITNTGGEEPQWEAYQIIGEERVSSDPSLPAVLNSAYSDAIADQQAEITRYEQQEQQHAAMIAEIEAANAADLAALQVASTEIRANVQAIRTEAENTSRQVQATQDEVINRQRLVDARRTDVFRLQAQYDEFEVDQFRAEQLIAQLRQLIHQLDGELERAQRREQQLIEQGATLPGDTYTE